MASVIVMAGVLAMLVALLSGSSAPNSENPAQSKDREAVDPVAPLDPNDLASGERFNDTEPDGPNPFANSYGASGRRKVTVQVSANGYLGIRVYYRDRQKPKTVAVNKFSQTRTMTGRLPMAVVVMQLPGSFPGSATRATCTITIDGLEVDTQTTKKKPWSIQTCAG